MSNISPALNAALCAIQGASVLNTAMPVLNNESLARAIALAPNVHSVERAIAALGGNLFALLDATTIADPALHDAVAQLIGTTEGRAVLVSWARMMPAAWGRTHADALVDAVQKKQLPPDAAAALIGPCDETARLLRFPNEIAFAIRCWGQAFPDAPIAWMNAISAGERNRLLTALRSNPHTVALCMPWMPPDGTNQTPIKTEIGTALAAFTEASPSARALHGEMVKRLVAQAHPEHIEALTRLACAMQSENIWRRVQNLIQRSPSAAEHVVLAASWDNLPESVRTIAADLHVAIGAARGRRPMSALYASKKTAAAFFAALDPNVWDSLDAHTQRLWLHVLSGGEAHRAVSSLGVHTEILARASLINPLVCAARRSGCHDDALYAALFPVALHDLPPDAAHALIAALPTLPPDPGAFFVIASAHSDLSAIDSGHARTTFHAPADLACAVVLQRCADRSTSTRVCCMALQHALRRRTWKGLASMMALLDDNARAAIMLDRDTLVERLAHPDRKEALRHALDRLTSLPPEVAIPTFVVLNLNPLQAASVADVIADTLHADGDVFLTLTDSIDDERLRTALLPLPEDAALADALRNLARDDPSSAQRLAYALRSGAWRATIRALLTMPPHHADAVWQAMSERFRHTIISRIGCPPPSESLILRAPIAGLALAALQSNDANLLDAGNVALAVRSDILRTIWDALPHDIQQRLQENPALADLSPISEHFAPQHKRGWRLS